MAEYFTWFVSAMVYFGLCYLISHRLIRNRPKFEVSHVSLGILFALVLTGVGVLSYDLNENLLWNFIRKIIIFISLLIGFKMLYGRNLLDTFFLTVVTRAITTSGLLPLIFLRVFNINQQLPQFIMQMGVVLLVMLVCEKVQLYKLYDIFQHKLLPNMVAKQIFLIFYVLLFFYSLIAISSYGPNLRYHALFLSILVLFIVILIPMMIKLYQMSIKEMVLSHDLYNSLLSIGIVIESMNDLEAVKYKLKEYYGRFGIDLSNGDGKETDQCGINQQIERFIHLKKRHRKTNVEIISDIGYYKDHHGVELQQLLQWLGTLLDNAIEASTKHPIYVRAMVTGARISLSVANEYLGDRMRNFDEMFEKGYSTKGEGRGLGLYQLQQIVSELGGHVTCFEEYKAVYDSYYLTILIEFKQDMQFNEISYDR